MSEQEMVSAMAAHDFFHGVSEAHLKAIGPCVQSLAIPAGAFLGREGEVANALYLIQSGHVALEVNTPDRGAIAIQTVGPGQIVGWSWFVPPYRWQFDAQATEPVRVIVLDARCVIGKCEQDHELGYHFFKRLAEIIAGRLAATRLQLLDVYK